MIILMNPLIIMKALQVKCMIQTKPTNHWSFNNPICSYVKLLHVAHLLGILNHVLSQLENNVR